MTTLNIILGVLLTIVFIVISYNAVKQLVAAIKSRRKVAIIYSSVIILAWTLFIIYMIVPDYTVTFNLIATTH